VHAARSYWYHPACRPGAELSRIQFGKAGEHFFWPRQDANGSASRVLTADLGDMGPGATYSKAHRSSLAQHREVDLQI